MEVLVEEEAKTQLKALPARVASYINQVELIAYALNQLPSLYATSQQGLEYQVQRGRTKFGTQITQAVQRAIAAIRRDPLRTCVPLQSQPQSVPLRDVLHQLRLVLKNDKVDWETLPTAVAEALAQSGAAGVTWDARYETASSSSYASSRQSTDAVSVPTADLTHLHWKGNAKQQVHPKPEYSPHRAADRSDSGWDDPFHKV